MGRCKFRLAGCWEVASSLLKHKPFSRLVLRKVPKLRGQSAYLENKVKFVMLTRASRYVKMQN